jgi:sarcosine oxidase
MGVSALGIDRHFPPHSFGSSHGDSRITRHAVGEGSNYVPFVMRSHALWSALEDEVGIDRSDDKRRLFLRTGGLVIGRPTPKTMTTCGTTNTKTSFVERTVNVAREMNIHHEVLDANELKLRYPQFGYGIVGDELGCYEPSAGVVYPERIIGAQLDMACRLDARTLLGTVVRSVSSLDVDGHHSGGGGGGGGVRVTTDAGIYHAARVIIASGAWSSSLVPSLVPLTRVRRQVMHWFAPANPHSYSYDRFPVYIWHHGHGVGDYFYGFPCLPGERYMKMATEQSEFDADSADDVNRGVDEFEADSFYERHVKRLMTEIVPNAEKSVGCMYTVTPDGGFVIDETSPGVLVASACSGHGFKHSAGLGEALAERACGGDGGGGDGGEEGSMRTSLASLLDSFGADRFRRDGESAVGNRFHSGLSRR